jgi:RNA polymerase sigma factor (sigma-70 family)
MDDVTSILASIESGDAQAAEQLLPLVYDELRKLARSKLRHEQPGQTLEATALVHEAYLRLVGGKGDRERGTRDRGDDSEGTPLSPVPCTPSPASFDSRGHFFSAAAEAMRRILVESARRKQRLKRGGDREREPLDDIAVCSPDLSYDLLELDEALNRLAEKHPRKVELVKLRYFAGLTIEEAAAALGISTTTAERDWTYARAKLLVEISKTKL